MRRIPSQKHREQAGFSILELVVVILIILIVAGIVIPSAMQTWYDLELRAASSSLSDLMQRDRILAAKNNQTYPIGYRVYQGVTEAYIDLNANGSWDTGEPIVEFPRRISAASGAPSSSPTPFTLVGDTTSGTPFDNATPLAFTPRGLPCAYSYGTNTCSTSTPSPTYFVYYFQDNRPNGWTAVYVTKAGRTHPLVWNGTSWH